MGTHYSGLGLYTEMLRGPRAVVKHTLSWHYSLCPFMPPPLALYTHILPLSQSAHSRTRTTDILGRRLTKGVDGSGMTKANPNTHCCIKLPLSASMFARVGRDFCWGYFVQFQQQPTHISPAWSESITPRCSQSFPSGLLMSRKKILPLQFCGIISMSACLLSSRGWQSSSKSHHPGQSSGKSGRWLWVLAVVATWGGTCSVAVAPWLCLGMSSKSPAPFPWHCWSRKPAGVPCSVAHASVAHISLEQAMSRSQSTESLPRFTTVYEMVLVNCGTICLALAWARGALFSLTWAAYDFLW